MRGRPLIPLLVCAFALTLAGCGSDDGGTIPPGDADTMLNYIQAIEEAVAEGDCEAASDNATELVNVVNTLPNDVDTEVAGELTRAADNLNELADTDCVAGTSDVTGLDTTETDATAEPTETTTTTTTEPETTTDEEPTDEEQTDEEPADEQPTDQGGPEEDQGSEPPTGDQGGGGQSQGGGVSPSSGGVEPGGDGG
jgi:hypothetical protein